MEDGMEAAVLVIPRWAFKWGVFKNLPATTLAAIEKRWFWVRVCPEKLNAGDVHILYKALRLHYANKTYCLHYANKTYYWESILYHFSGFYCRRAVFRYNKCLCVQVWNDGTVRFAFHIPYQKGCLGR